MKKTISPCYTRKSNGRILKIYWKGTPVPKSVYCANVQTAKLEKLVNWSRLPAGLDRNRLYRKPWLRGKRRSDNDFRYAIIERIKELTAALKTDLNKKMFLARNGRQIDKSDPNNRELTPSVQSWKHFTDLKVKLEAMMKSAPTWDDETRAAVVVNMEKTCAFLSECKSNLQS